MENTDHYLINIQAKDAARENTFFRALFEIDPHPFTVISNAVYAIKSELGLSEIAKALSDTLRIEDMLLIVPINKYEAHSPEFIHWIKFGD